MSSYSIFLSVLTWQKGCEVRIHQGSENTAKWEKWGLVIEECIEDNGTWGVVLELPTFKSRYGALPTQQNVRFTSPWDSRYGHPTTYKPIQQKIGNQISGERRYYCAVEKHGTKDEEYPGSYLEETDVVTYCSLISSNNSKISNNKKNIFCTNVRAHMVVYLWKQYCGFSYVISTITFQSSLIRGKIKFDRIA